ncbi:MAG: hypothetical protein PHE43_01030 [Candidatus Nanoarchaeia archaeon]|nr:hypothetical protein [Candidatus Nanoarchaeia archaeon]
MSVNLKVSQTTEVIRLSKAVVDCLLNLKVVETDQQSRLLDNPIENLRRFSVISFKVSEEGEEGIKFKNMIKHILSEEVEDMNLISFSIQTFLTNNQHVIWMKANGNGYPRSWRAYPKLWIFILKKDDLPQLLTDHSIQLEITDNAKEEMEAFLK